MVDKENQWDDIEYTDDEAEYEEADTQEEYADEEYESDEYEDEEYSDEEYSDEEYDEEYDDEDDDEDEAEENGSRSSIIPIIAILLVVLLLCGAGFFAYTKFSGGTGSIAKTPGKASNEAIHVQGENNDFSVNNQNASGLGNQSEPPQQANTQDMGDFFFNEAGGNDENMMSVDFNDNGQANISQAQSHEGLGGNGNNDVVATVTEQPGTTTNELSPEDILGVGGFNESEENPDNAILIAYNKEKRANPFKPPFVEKGEELDGVNETGFEIIEPPSTSIQDENLKKLLQTQISGILYDEVSPSAIVNLNGVDQFVKIGDEVSGYVIEDIRRDKVQISYKNNSYVASVGELFTRGLLEKQPAVANFENKFAGRYRENN